MNVRNFAYLNLCQNCISCAYAYHRAVGFSRCCEFMLCCLKRSVSPLRSVEDKRRCVHGAFMLHIVAHTSLLMCTYIYVNQIRLFVT